MLSDLDAWMAEWVFEAQQTFFKAFEMTIMQYKFGWNSRLKKLKRELTSVLSGPVLLSDHLKELSASLEQGASSRAQVEAGSTDVAEVRSPGADDLTGPEVKFPGPDVPVGPDMQFPGADDPAASNTEIDKLYA